jgi:CTP:molybdopterin cytidylyltransferase MocA
MTVAAVVLCAGAGSRFAGEGHKLLAKARGRPLVSWAVGAARDAALEETVVVMGAVDLTDVLPDDVTLLSNERWKEGQSSSLRVAVDWCARQGHTAAVIGLGDQPGLTVAAWQSLAAPSPTPVAIATYGKRRGHPVRLEAAVWPLLPVSGDEGARRLIAARPELVTEVPCEGDPRDIDSREDLRRWS